MLSGGIYNTIMRLRPGYFTDWTNACGTSPDMFTHSFFEGLGWAIRAPDGTPHVCLTVQVMQLIK